jgi:EcsC protein family
MHPDYESNARRELQRWQTEMQQPPGFFNSAAQGLQRKLNGYIPERVHQAITAIIEQMTRAMLAGSSYTTAPPLTVGTLQERERRIAERIEFFRKAAAAEGGVTGAGGVFLGLADFPLLLTLKLKLLFEIAALYGYSGDDYTERLYLLYIFQLAFSNAAHRCDVYTKLPNWRDQPKPTSIDEFDWRVFQQQYRDYIDLAKLAQLIPIIGAPVGVVVNYRLVRKLGDTAINAYRMRWFEEQRGDRALLRDEGDVGQKAGSNLPV